AIAAPQTVLLVNHDHAIGGDKGRADGTDLGAGRIGTMVAEFRNKEVLSAFLLGGRETVDCPIGGIDLRHLGVPFGNVVALDPGAVITVGDIVLRLAGLDAGTATDALGDVDKHAPPVGGHFVVGGLLGRARED